MKSKSILDDARSAQLELTTRRWRISQTLLNSRSVNDDAMYSSADRGFVTMGRKSNVYLRWLNLTLWTE